MALDDVVAFLKRKSEANELKEKPVCQPCGEEKEEAMVWRTRAELYKKIIAKYAEVINLGEQKAVPELKELVKPDDDTIQRLKNRFVEELSLAYQPPWSYEFDRDFLSYAKKCFSFVRGLRPIRADLSVSYWLSPAEIVELNAADPLDKAILLCSLLVAGGCKTVVVRVLLLEGGLKHAVVVFSFKDGAHVYDASNPKEEVSGKDAEELLKAFDYEGKKVLKALYEFNNLEYNDFE